MIDAAGIERALVVLAPVSILAGLLTAGLIALTWPWLRSYALARPNARSSHRQPTPQGGGIAVVVATLAVAWGAVAFLPAFAPSEGGQFLAITAAAIGLAFIGAIDDLRTLPAALRLDTIRPAERRLRSLFCYGAFSSSARAFRKMLVPKARELELRFGRPFALGMYPRYYWVQAYRLVARSRKPFSDLA